ncbi:MAG: UvrB/UvrC motif-containing protein [candidate division WOR-3 bacterium]|nr:UvrB/UvrC motif-containing protein [candidate division WOR-3 bacterium]
MKKCSICQKAAAVVVITTIDKDGKTMELALCQECAAKKGVGEIKKIKLSVQEILAELQEKVSEDDYNLICDSCGMSYADFRKKGRLGCANCYQAFAAKLETVIKRSHNATQHIGKTTTGGRKRVSELFEIKKLRASLQNAIAKEDYELAAKIRDEISKLRHQKAK